MERYKIKLNDGKIPVIVCNERDEDLGIIYISPTDFNIVKRLEEAKACIDKIKIADENADGDTIKKLDRQIREQIDYAFDYNVSDVVFKNQHTLSTYNGVTFVERFLEGIEPVIKKIVGAENQKTQNRMNQYTRPYTNDHNKKKKKKGKGNDRRITEVRNNREKKVQD